MNDEQNPIQSEEFRADLDISAEESEARQKNFARSMNPSVSDKEFESQVADAKCEKCLGLGLLNSTTICPDCEGTGGKKKDTD